LPRVEALRSLVARVRDNPWLAVGIVAAVVLVAAWLGWTIYVASDRGVNEGLGVLVAWPAMVAALALISLPFIGGYLLIKRLAPEGNHDAGETDEQLADDETSEEQEEEADEDDDAAEEDEEEGDADDEEDEEDEDEDEGDEEDEEEAEPEPETAKK
jgi:hypothetical protein